MLFVRGDIAIDAFSPHNIEKSFRDVQILGRYMDVVCYNLTITKNIGKGSEGIIL